MKIAAVILAAAVLASLIIINITGKEVVIERTLLCMGTVVQIRVPVSSTEDRALAMSAIDKAFDELRRVEGVFSVYLNESEISRINRSRPGEKVKVSDETFGLLERSLDGYHKTKGAFDITVKPLVDLWKAAGAKKRLPGDEELKTALAKVGSQYIELDSAGRTVSFKKEDMAIDLGGIAKGYATDRAVMVLKENGIKNAIVNSGGDMYCLGRRSGSRLWSCGIQHPRARGYVFMRVYLQDKAIVTSGDYEKYFILGGRRYSHIIDQRSGYPIGDDVVSATTIAYDAATADIFATALCILGKEGLPQAAANGIQAVIILKKKDGFEIVKSEGFKERYEIAK